MTIPKYIKQLAVMAIVMLLLDIVYLSTIGAHVFSPMIKTIQCGTPLQLKLLPAALVYIVMISGLYYFIIRHNRSVLEAAFLGLLVYLVYDLTNIAILSNYLWSAVILDGLWGGILFAITTALTYYLAN